MKSCCNSQNSWTVGWILFFIRVVVNFFHSLSVLDSCKTLESLCLVPRYLCTQPSFYHQTVCARILDGYTSSVVSACSGKIITRRFYCCDEKIIAKILYDARLSFQRLSTDMTASSWNPKELNASISLDSACPPSAENRYVRRLSLMTGRPIRLGVLPPELQRQRSCDPDHPVSQNLLNTIEEW